MISFRFLELSVSLLFAKDSSVNKSMQVARNDLFHRSSFRLTNSENSKLLVALGGLKQLLRELMKPRREIRLLKKFLIYDVVSDPSQIYLRRNYLVSMGYPIDETGWVSRVDLIRSLPVLDRLLLVLALPFTGFLYLIVWIMKDYRKENLHFIQRAIVEILAFERILSNSYVTEVLYFASYEVDANFGYLRIKNLVSKVTKFPSPNPLKFHYPAVLTDKLVLSSRYQLEEFERDLKDKSVVAEVSVWIPEGAPLYLDRYLKDNEYSYSASLGFYSSAYWLRLDMGRAEVANWSRIEKESLLRVAKIANSFGESLVVFLHPKEKLLFEKAGVEEYYSELLEGFDFRFYSLDVNESTAFAFDCVELAISPLTTTFFERIFCGFKTFMIKEPSVKEFPIPESSIASICLELDLQFESCVLSALEMTEKEFFSVNGLSDYYLNGLDPREISSVLRRTSD